MRKTVIKLRLIVESERLTYVVLNHSHPVNDMRSPFSPDTFKQKNSVK